MANCCDSSRKIHTRAFASITSTDCEIPFHISTRLQERLCSGKNSTTSPSYVVVEKILARGEDLPDDWPVAGTTGYDYVNAANGIFVDPAGRRRIEEIYSSIYRTRPGFL